MLGTSTDILNLIESSKDICLNDNMSIKSAIVSNVEDCSRPEIKELLLMLKQSQEQQTQLELENLLYSDYGSFDKQQTPPIKSTTPQTPLSTEAPVDCIPFSTFHSNLYLKNDHGQHRFTDSFINTPPFSTRTTLSDNNSDSEGSATKPQFSSSAPWDCRNFLAVPEPLKSASDAASDVDRIPSMPSSARPSPLLYPLCSSSFSNSSKPRKAPPSPRMWPSLWSNSKERPADKIKGPLVQPISDLSKNFSEPKTACDESASPNKHILYVLENLARSIEQEYALESRAAVFDFIQRQLDILKQDMKYTKHSPAAEGEPRKDPMYWQSLGLSILQQLEHTSKANERIGERPLFPFNCPIPGCQRGYLRMGNLELHVRTHLNPQTNFNAQQCFAIPMFPQLGFFSAAGGKAKSSFRAGPHYKYTCDACGKKFTRTHDLKRHARQHTNEKPFPCKSCHRGFSRSDALVRHTKMGCTPLEALAKNADSKSQDSSTT